MTRADTNPRITAGVDGSRHALAAARWAAGEALARGLPLRLLHVEPKQLEPNYLGDAVAASIGTNAVWDRSQQALDEAARECRSVSEFLEIDTELCYGDMDRALAEDGELVVIGARGQDTPEGTAIGSTAAEMVQHARCPVVIVLTVDDETFPVREQPGPVVVGVEASGNSEPALTFAADYAMEHGRPLVIVHVLTATPMDTADPIQPWRGEEQRLREQGNELLDLAAERQRERHPGITVNTVLAEASPVDALLQEAEKADMLVVGSHGRGPIRRLFLGSVSRALPGRARCPVAIVH